MHFRNPEFRKGLPYAACAFAAGIAVVGGVGYLIGSPTLAGLRRSYIPIAPSTVATILLLAGGLTAHILGATPRGRRAATWLRAAAAVPAGLSAALG